MKNAGLKSPKKAV